MSAVSKKLTPTSTARRTIGSAASSRKIHGRDDGSPKLIMPRAIRETLRPDEPNRRYSMFHRPFLQGCTATPASSAAHLEKVACDVGFVHADTQPDVDKWLARCRACQAP